jgi:hypothetical protein
VRVSVMSKSAWIPVIFPPKSMMHIKGRGVYTGCQRMGKPLSQNGRPEGRRNLIPECVEAVGAAFQ